MESWRMVWRNGMEPLLSTEGLEALRQALMTDDPRLLQGATTTPPPLMCVQEWPVEGACALWASAAGTAMAWRRSARWKSSSLACASEVDRRPGRASRLPVVPQLGR